MLEGAINSGALHRHSSSQQFQRSCLLPRRSKPAGNVASGCSASYVRI